VNTGDFGVSRENGPLHPTNSHHIGISVSRVSRESSFEFPQPLLGPPFLASTLRIYLAQPFHGGPLLTVKCERRS
jgi:hypothetical protein